MTAAARTMQQKTNYKGDLSFAGAPVIGIVSVCWDIQRRKRERMR
jgi:hypothetical protein